MQQAPGASCGILVLSLVNPYNYALTNLWNISLSESTVVLSIIRIAMVILPYFGPMGKLKKSL